MNETANKVQNKTEKDANSSVEKLTRNCFQQLFVAATGIGKERGGADQIEVGGKK